METNAAYQSYIADAKNLKTTQGRIDYQKPYAEGFEEIYASAMDENIKLSTAKTFIENLSQDELTTIQKYNGLADAIDRGSLSAEAAYNLLVHDNEQYDFDGDGRIQVGAANMVPVLPATMPKDVRAAYIEALNTLDGVDRMMAMTLTFDMGRISSTINNTPYEPQIIDYDYLSKQVEARLNPQGGAITSESSMRATRTFWEAFQNAYKGEKNTSKTQESDPAVEKFLKDLLTKGAAAFLSEFNMEKIEKKVEEYRQKLMKEMGDSPQSLAKIEELVIQYKKQLMEELQASIDEEEEGAIRTPQAMIKILLDMKAEENTPLEKLLQEESKKVTS